MDDANEDATMDDTKEDAARRCFNITKWASREGVCMTDVINAMIRGK